MKVDHQLLDELLIELTLEELLEDDKLLNDDELLDDDELEELDRLELELDDELLLLDEKLRLDELDDTRPPKRSTSSSIRFKRTCRSLICCSSIS